MNFDLDNSVDEDFFGFLKGKSSKLQQLFGEDVLSADEKQQSLKYQRPKATDFKAKEDADASSSTNPPSITLMAKVVVAYKQGELQGKVGLALIQSPNNTCAIIIYKTKLHVLTTLKLEAAKDLLYKQTKYWQFYDEESIYWSFSFETQQDEYEFVEKLTSRDIAFKESQTNERALEKEYEKPSLDNNVENFDNEEDFLSLSVKTDMKGSKTSLIKRMAKMGKPLPTLSSFNQQATTDFSDSSDTEVIKTPLAMSQKPSIAPRSNKISSIKTNQQLVPSVGAYATANTDITGSVYPINPLESQYMQMLLTEQRTQGSELRMNMHKLENKIEKVLDKLDLHDRYEGREKPHKDDEILELEEKLLMLKKENRKLKQNLDEKFTMETQENKIKDVVNHFKKDLENFNINPNQDLRYLLRDVTDRLKENHIIKEENQQKLKQTESKLDELKTELFLNNSKNIDLEKQITLLKEQEQMLKLNLNEKESEITQNKQQVLDLQKALELKTQESLQNPADALVKSIMNNLYVDLADKLGNSNLPHTDEILTLIASSIKQQTLKSLQQTH